MRIFPASVAIWKTLGFAISASLFSGFSVAGEMASLELRPGVRFEVPAGTRLQKTAGIDSDVGTIIGKQFECAYDLGFYSNPLTDIANASVAETSIADRRARVIAEGGAVDGLHVEEIDKTVLGNVNLTLLCTSETDEARQAVRAMFQTLAIE